MLSLCAGFFTQTLRYFCLKLDMFISTLMIWRVTYAETFRQTSSKRLARGDPSYIYADCILTPTTTIHFLHADAKLSPYLISNPTIYTMCDQPALPFRLHNNNQKKKTSIDTNKFQVFGVYATRGKFPKYAHTKHSNTLPESMRFAAQCLARVAQHHRGYNIYRRNIVSTSFRPMVRESIASTARA